MEKRRTLSPSSINLYKQCPRKFFYQYILRLPTKPSIHLIRGSIVHEVLEKFFSLNPDDISKEDYKFFFKSYLTANLFKLWKNNQKKLAALKMTNYQLEQYLVDSQNMLTNFVDMFSSKLKKRITMTGSFDQAFKELTPIVEEKLVNEELGVMGYVDAIHNIDDKVIIIDYKTSSKDHLSPEYKLQLAIYALMYKRKYGLMPNKVGINFLKFGEQFLDVDQKMLDDAKQEIEFVHEQIKSREIRDYPKHESGLCKWSTGQCDFYEVCMKDKIK
jgi:ATP-dependent helicase/DNAse subunit B